MSQLRIVTYIVMGLFFTLGASDALAAKVNEEKVSKELAPMPKPEYRVGLKMHFVKDGEKTTFYAVTAKDAGTISLENHRGCSWTKSDSVFAPSTKWNNCKAANATQKVEVKGSDIWPLKVGNKVQYKFKGSDDSGQTWSSVRKCKVKKQVRIKTVSGEHDTYKVVCVDKWNTHTYWMSPELKAFVRYEKKHISRGTKVWETTKVEWP